MKIGVYGLGRFGRFWVQFLISQGFEVYAYNRTARDLPFPIVLIDLESLCQLDVVFLCTSISSISQVAAEIAPLLSPKTLVMDTCSVKLYPLNELNTYLSHEQAILGTHPMFGPDSAEGKQLTMVLSPWRATQDMLRYWSELFGNAGLNVMVKSAEEHDREAARTQGITHFIGRFLSSLELQPSSMSTLGFQKIFEVMEQTCNDPWQLFLDLQRFNPYTSEVRKQMQKHFNDMIHLLDNEMEKK